MPADGKTLLLYDEPIARLPLPVVTGGMTYSTRARSPTATIRGLPYAGSDTYEVEVDAAARSTCRTSSSRRPSACARTSRSRRRPAARRRQAQDAFFFECFGEVARATSKQDETERRFHHRGRAAPLRACSEETTMICGTRGRRASTLGERDRASIEQVLKNPSCSGPSGAMLTAAMKAKAAADARWRAWWAPWACRRGAIRSARSTRSTSSRAASTTSRRSSPARSRATEPMNIRDRRPHLHIALRPRPRGFDRPRRTATACASWSAAGDGVAAVTWGAFALQIRGVALFLASTGSSPAIGVAIFAPNRVEWTSAALGIQAAGGVMVPIYAASTRPSRSRTSSSTATRSSSSSTPPRSSARSS